MKTYAQLVFFGTEDFSVPSLEALISAGWPIAAVVSKPDSKAGRGQKFSSPKVKALAQVHKIPILQPEKLIEIKETLSGLSPTHGVLVAYGKLVPKEVIDLFPGGIINIHPSILPKYRGPAPIEAAILNGDNETAVSLMQLTPGMDEGPVYLQKKVNLKGDEDRLSLSRQLSLLGAGLLCDKLPAIIEGALKPKPQDNAQATYTKLLKKEDGLTDWQEPAEVLERKVRAYLGFPKVKGHINSHEIVINKARIAKNMYDGALVVACNPGYLEILKLTAPSGRLISGADFIRGYKN